MKIQDVAKEDIIKYLRIDSPTETETAEVERMMDSAKAQIKSYTGLDDEGINAHDDLTQAFFIMVADMFDNRNLQLDYKSVAQNKSVECILNMHSENLL